MCHLVRFRIVIIEDLMRSLRHRRRLDSKSTRTTSGLRVLPKKNEGGVSEGGVSQSVRVSRRRRAR
jgi:hypothetical protein